MAAINGIQLLTVPKPMKENILPTKISIQPPIESQKFKLLSMPVTSSAEKAPKLIAMPKQAHPFPSLPLLTLPKNAKNSTGQRPVTIFPVDSNKGYDFPLLKKSVATEHPRLIKIPIAKENAQGKPFLIKVPVDKQKILATRDQDEQKYYKNSKFSLSPSNFNEGFAAQMMSIPKKTAGQSIQGQKQERKRHRADSNEAMAKLNEIDTEISDTQSKATRINQKMSTGTQTAQDSKEKMQQRKKKLNLLNLLEKAALLEGSDFSSDEESILDVMKNRSHLVKEEPYSRKIEKDRLEIGVKKPTIEELLLQNFDEAGSSSSRHVFNEHHKGAEAYRGSQMVRKTESSTQTFDNVRFPRMDSNERPKAAAGPLWSELISISSNKEIEYKDPAVNIKEVGIQVSASVPKIDKIEQMSQTDFTQDENVATLLLQNLQEERNAEKKADTLKYNGDVLAVESRYPWQYIANADVSDVLTSKNENNARRHDKSAAIANHSESSINNMKFEPMKEQAFEQSMPGELPPHLLFGTQFEDNSETEHVDTNVAKQMAKPAEISKPCSPLSEEVDINEFHVVKGIPVEKLNESMERQVVNKELQIVHENMHTGIRERKLHKAGDELTETQKPVDSELFDPPSWSPHQSDNWNKKSKISFRSGELKKMLDTGPKDRLHRNLRNMSVQLDALDELYEHLETEMKNSSMLMKTVDTLYTGFFDEPEVFKKGSYRNSSAANQSRDFSHARSNAGQQPSLDAVREEKLEEVVGTEMKDLRTGKIPLEESAEFSLEADAAETSLRSHAKEGGCEIEGKSNEALNEENEEDLSHPSHELTEEEAVGSSFISDAESDSGRSLVSQARSQKISGAENVMDEEATVRERIAKKFPTLSKQRIEEDEVSKDKVLKQKLESKRKALQAWMKNKRSEQNEKYLKEIGEKREKECRPFAATKNIPAVSSKRKLNVGNAKTKKTFVTEEAFQERIDGAQQLLDDLLAVRSDAVSIEKSAQPVDAKVERKRPRKSNFRMKPATKVKRTIAGVYDRKNRKGEANGIAGFGSDRAEDRNTVGKLILDNISPNWKKSSLEDFLDVANIDSAPDVREMTDSNLFLELPPDNWRKEPYTSTARSGSGRYRLDFGQLSDRRTSNLNSARTKSQRSVEGRDFVTRASMDNYKKKTAQLVRDSMRDYASTEMYDDNQTEYGSDLGSKVLRSSDFLTDNERLMLDRIMDERESGDESVVNESKRQRIRSPLVSTHESEDVNDILMQYGLLDDDLKRNGSQETSKLLAEADALLRRDSESENSSPGDPIDWDEINDILKRD